MVVHVVQSLGDVGNLRKVPKNSLGTAHLVLTEVKG